MNQERINQNKITIKGRLVNQPDIRVTGATQREYARIVVATSFTSVTKDNIVYYNNCTLWKDEDIKVIRNLGKGDTIQIVGRLVDKKINNPDGTVRSTIEILPYEVKVADKNSCDINKVELYGRLVSKPELKKTSTGKSFSRIAVAVANNKSKEKQGPADFFNMALWGKSAENACNLEKAEWVEMVGILKNSKYTDKSGKDIYGTEIVLTKFKKKNWEVRDGETSSQQNNSQFDNIDMDFEDIEPVDDASDMPF